MKLLRLTLCTRALFFFSALAFGGTVTVNGTGWTMYIAPSLAPNVYGSPSWDGYVANATTSIKAATGSAQGDLVNHPTQYYAVAPSTIPAADMIATNYSEWMGVVDPSTSPYSGESGNRLHFGLDITSSTAFLLSNLVVTVTATGTSGAAAYFNTTYVFTSADSYSLAREGFVTGNPTPITSGAANSQAVNQLVYVGWGDAIPSYTSGNDAAAFASTLNGAYSQLGNFTLQVCYSVNGTGIQGCDSEFVVTPEPSAAGLLGFGLAGVLLFCRKLIRPKS